MNYQKIYTTRSWNLNKKHGVVLPGPTIYVDATLSRHYRYAIKIMSTKRLRPLGPLVYLAVSVIYNIRKLGNKNYCHLRCHFQRVNNISSVGVA